MFTIDAHAHVFTAATPLLTDAWEHKTRPAPVSALLSEMAAHDVSHAVLATAEAYGDSHDDFAEALSAHPNLRATISLPDTTTARCLRGLRDQGFIGTRLHRHKAKDPPAIDTQDTRAFLRRLADEGWHVHLTEHPDRMAATLAILNDCGVPAVVDHLGLIDRPEGADHPGFIAIRDAVSRGRTWVKLSGHFRFANAQAADAQSRALAADAPERLIWASDWPFVGYRDSMSYAQAHATLDQYIADPDARRAVAGATAHALFFEP